MSALHRASTIYVDLDNVLINTDYFVCNMLYKSLKDNKDVIAKSPIHSFFDIIDETGEDFIEAFSNTKNGINPLRDFADISVMSDEELREFRDNDMSDDDILDMVCNNLYDEIELYDYQHDIIEDVKFTDLASSLKILAKDLQLKNIYIYSKIITEAMRKAIYEHFMDNSKVVLVTGDKEAFFNKVECDLYIVNDITDIDLLPEKNTTTEDRPDFMFLNSPCNMELWYGDKYLDKDNTHTTICDKYNINVSIMNIY